MLQLPPSNERLFSADVWRLRAAGALLLVVLCASSARAQGPATSPLSVHLNSLSSLDYQTRMNAARLIRRAPIPEAVAALTEAVRSHADQFVRYRALVMLTSFNDRATAEVMRGALRDRNDRVREIAYKWFEANPDAGLSAALLAALQAEQAEFVRPALVGALAALGSDAAVQRAMLVEINRGLDFFRSAVIDSLGRHHATYAVAAIAAIATLEGPLQDDAVLALGRIGGTQASAAIAAVKNPPPDVVPTIRAARCIIGDGCDAAIAAFVESAARAATPPLVTRAAIAALGTIAAVGNRAAAAALVTLAPRGGTVRAEAALALAGAAVRAPDHVLGWLDAAPAEVRDPAIDLLKEGFEDLEEDLGKEMFFAATRATYWKADEASATRTLAAALIQKLEF